MSGLASDPSRWEVYVSTAGIRLHPNMWRMSGSKQDLFWGWEGNCTKPIITECIHEEEDDEA